MENSSSCNAEDDPFPNLLHNFFCLTFGKQMSALPGVVGGLLLLLQELVAAIAGAGVTTMGEINRSAFIRSKKKPPLAPADIATIR
nr:hypothetical protein [Desulfotalea psychrophila]